MPEGKKNCFVVMPISDSDEYDDGHFSRVYEHLIKPACQAAEFEVIRADDVRNTNLIILDILKRIISADIVVVDLSGKNPNVMYELGIRQAFDLPVVLIKDTKTQRVFDIQGLRTIDYDESLRIDSVARNSSAITKTLTETLEKHDHDSSSLRRLLSLNKAELQQDGELSNDTALVLSALSDLSERVTRMEQPSPRALTTSRQRQWRLPSGEIVRRGEEIWLNGKELGKFYSISASSDKIRIIDNDGNMIELPNDSDEAKQLATLPF